MNNFFNNLRWRLQRFMQGRYGPDKLTSVLLWTGLGIYILNLFLRWPVLVYLSLAVYAWSIFRMFSKNRVARATENQKFFQFWYSLKTSLNQRKLRLKNSKEYKYFHCPKCHTVLRSRRGGGKRTITCPKCGNQFEIKS